MSRSRSPRRHERLKLFVRSRSKLRRKSRRFAVIYALKSTEPKPVAKKKEADQWSHHTSSTEVARFHGAHFKESTERTIQAANPKVGYLEAGAEYFVTAVNCIEMALVSPNHCNNR